MTRNPHHFFTKYWDFSLWRKSLVMSSRYWYVLLVHQSNILVRMLPASQIYGRQAINDWHTIVVMWSLDNWPISCSGSWKCDYSFSLSDARWFILTDISSNFFYRAPFNKQEFLKGTQVWIHIQMHFANGCKDHHGIIMLNMLPLACYWCCFKCNLNQGCNKTSRYDGWKNIVKTSY